jgi:hypothetical protein
MVFEGIPPPLHDVSFQIHPKGKEKVENNWGSQCQTGDIDEIFTDGKGGNAHFFTDTGAYPQNLPFDEIPQLVHTQI